MKLIIKCLESHAVVWHTSKNLNRKNELKIAGTDFDIQNNRCNSQHLLLERELLAVVNLLPPGEVAVFALAHQVVVRGAFAVVESNEGELHEG